MTAFDALAADYDRDFSDSQLGSLFRRAVWERCAAAFDGAVDVLELNCGTGVDAVWLARRGHRVLATDASAAMLAQARAAVTLAGLDPTAAMPAIAIPDGTVPDGTVPEGSVPEGSVPERSVPEGTERARGEVRTRALRLEDVAELAAEGRRFDAVLSNFGGLNCVQDLDAVLEGMAAAVVPGGRALLCVMGPVVPWEWAWFLGQGQPRRAVRRLVRNPQWRGLALRYPRPGQLATMAARHGWTTRRLDALGALAPPPFAERWARRHPTTVRRLAALERRWATNPVLVRSADHYLIELERR